MKKMLFGFSIDDVILDGWSTPEHLNSILDFCAEEKISATFMVVPENESGVKAPDRKEYAGVMKRLLAEGHEIAQHGIRHNRFEIGIPPRMILDLPHEGPAREYLASHKDFLKKDHSVENIRQRLKYGRDILESGYGIKINGFRAPALQSCANMFKAIAEEGYTYDSSACLQETGWDYLNGNMDAKPRAITKERWQSLQKPGYVTLPLTTDYTWFLDEARYPSTFELAKHDFISSLNTGIPFVTVCHVSPVNEGLGWKFWHEFIRYMRSECELESLTLNGIRKSL